MATDAVTGEEHQRRARAFDKKNGCSRKPFGQLETPGCLVGAFNINLTKVRLTIGISKQIKNAHCPLSSPMTRATRSSSSGLPRISIAIDSGRMRLRYERAIGPASRQTSRLHHGFSDAIADQGNRRGTRRW